MVPRLPKISNVDGISAARVCGSRLDKKRERGGDEREKDTQVSKMEEEAGTLD
jgi:hypothetical protein